MTSSQGTRRAQQLLEGTIGVFLAEALLVPTGLLIAAFLTRRLGPSGYGLFALAATLVAWVEWALASAFARATIRFVGSVVDWRPVGATVVRLYLVASTGAMILFWCLASPVATLLNEDVLATYLRLFALDIPIYGLAQAHRQILVGVGRYKQRALVTAGRWLGRLLLIVLLVELGLSVPGAILGSIGASLVELVIARFYVRPPLRHRDALPVRQLWSYAAPLLLWALTIRLYDRLDLLALKGLAGTAADAGIYAAAQNVALALGLFSVAFAPLLLSTLSRTLRDGSLSQAKAIARNAMRVVIALTPVAAMIAGAAREISLLAFGAEFLPAAPLIGPLVVGALALTMMYVATSILTAAGKPRWTFAFVGPLVPLALVGHLLLIPRLGALGAALVTALFASLSALAEVVAIYRVWRILPPPATVWRSTLLCGVAYALAALWPTPGLLLFIKLPVIVGVTLFAFALLGEFNSSEMAAVRSILRRRTLRPEEPHGV
ncbi:MAG: oligosaccharide flippase family protein [Anaerolineae bacterium]|nr:oligosaccharide flippase family protein [Anaerolineae bacterium]NIN96949.1 oligosaccharide flippase family protein [Anaerolineae bacterium]NIQ79910.1 oligosaccharide flippase family protein [Anaerolineae bacterium]